MSKAIGIDLGTTHAVIGVWKNRDFELLYEMPTVVAFSGNKILTGHQAEKQAFINSKNTITGIKRIIGRRYNDLKLQEYLQTTSNSIEISDDFPKFRVNYKNKEKLCSSEYIVALLLKKLKNAAEIVLKETITRAVITVPACFNDCQREAVKAAAFIAGFYVINILNEPMAAAIAYGLDRSEKDGTKDVLIFDFGSGILNVSVHSIYCDTFKTLSTSGDFLGGLDFDKILFDYCAKIYQKEKKEVIQKEDIVMERLRFDCCRAKEILSYQTETKICIDERHLDLQINITRSEFEKMCTDILNSAIEMMHSVVIDSGLSKSDINDIILIGGSSKIPKIRDLISEYFEGKYIKKNFDKKAIACGAAAQAALLTGYSDTRIQNVKLIDVVTQSVGIENISGTLLRVIEKGSLIPTKETVTLQIPADNQIERFCRLFQGEHAMSCNNHFLGEIKVLNLPLPVKITLFFIIDDSGVLTVSGDYPIIIDKKNLSQETIKQMQNEITNELGLKMEQDKLIHLNRLEKFRRDICKATFTNNRLSCYDKVEINKIANDIRDWIQNNPAAEIDEVIEERKRVHLLLKPYSCLLRKNENFSFFRCFKFILLLVVLLGCLIYATDLV